jgi:hypothetical protein
LQQGKAAFESGILGQDWFLAKPEEAGKGQVPLAAGRTGGEGTDRGAAADAFSRDRFFQGAQRSILQKDGMRGKAWFSICGIKPGIQNKNKGEKSKKYIYIAGVM